MNFGDFIAQQSLKNHSIYNDSKRGFFIPHSALIVIDSAHDDLFRNINFNNIQVDSPEQIIRKYNEYFISHVHELIHCYQVIGTTTGYIECFLTDFQNSTFRRLKKNLKSDKKHNNNVALNRLYSAIQLRCLFSSLSVSDADFSKYQIPRVSDFENAFRTLIPIFSIIFNDLSANESHLFRKSFDNFIDRNDFLIYPKIEGEVFPGNFCYSHKDNATYLSAKVIIEGYARIIELCLFYFEFKGILGDQLIDIMLDIDEVQNEVDFAKLLDSIENEYHHFFIQYLREKTEGVYGCTIKILKKLLNHISNTSDFFETCIAIHELSLMTDFAPNSIYTTNKDVNLLDFLIPHRFVSAMRFFVDEKTSIRGMGNEETHFIQKMDAICNKLGWEKYSYLQEKLRCLYKGNFFENDYVNNLGQKITEKKFSRVFPISLELFLIDIGKLLPFQIFNDQVGAPYFDDDKNQELLTIAINSIIDDISIREFLFGSEFKLSNKIFSGIKDHDGFVPAALIDALKSI